MLKAKLERVLGPVSGKGARDMAGRSPKPLNLTENPAEPSEPAVLYFPTGGPVIKPTNILVNFAKSRSTCAWTNCTPVSGLKGAVHEQIRGRKGPATAYALAGWKNGVWGAMG